MLKKVQIFKALDVEIKKQKGPAAMKEIHRGQHSLKEELSQSGITIIAEVAGGNPIRGQVRESYRPGTHAKSLVENGARAISVATDRFLYFGEDKHLSETRSAVKCPLLRRDFIFEEYQVEESKILGADAIVLVAALLPLERLQTLQKLAALKGLDVVIEVFDQEDLDRALQAEAGIICVVGRNAETWEPSFPKAIELLKKVPVDKCLRMVEASVATLAQLKELEALGVHGVIVGDALLDEFYPGKRLAQILAGVEPIRKSPKPKAGKKAESESPSTPPKAASAKQAPHPPLSHPARKGKKEFPMEHIQSPEESQAPVETTVAEPAGKKSAPKKPAAKKAAPKKPAAKKASAPKKAAPKKPAAKKAAAPKKAAPKKPAAKKAAAPKKAAPKKTVAKKAAAPKKATPKKTVAKKAAAPKKAAPKKTVAKKAAAPKKAAPKKVVVKKAAAPKKAAPKKTVAKKAAAKKPVAKKAAASKKAAPKKVVAKKTAPKKPVAKKAAAPKKTVAKKPAAKKPAAKQTSKK